MAENKAKAVAHRFVAEIDEVELTARVMEAAIGCRRPIGLSAAQAIANAERSDPETAASFRRIARRALAYFSECVSKGSALS